MKPMQDLTINDFPGIDVFKFEEWKDAKAKAQQNLMLFLLILFLLNVVSLTTSGIFITGGLISVAIIYRIYRKSSQLQRELGLTKEMIRQARKNSAPVPSIN